MPDPLAAESLSVRSRTFAALQDNPAYRRFFAGQGISLVGTWLQAAAVSWIVFDITQSARVLGMVEAAGVMPGLIVGLVAGAMADRVPPRFMILCMQIGQMLLAFLLAAVVGFGLVQIWQLALILALTRVCLTFEMPSRQVFLYEVVGRSSLMNAIALNSGLFNASRVVGPALAGLCLAYLGWTSCFILNGASYLAAIAALLSIPAGRQLSLAHRKAPTDILGGFAYLRRDRRVAALFVLLTFFGFFGMGYAAMAPAYARLVVHTHVVGYSIILASSGLGATAGALFVASLGGLERKEILVWGGLGLFALSLGAAGTVPTAFGSDNPVALACLCMFGVGFGALIFFSSTQILIQTAVPDGLRGRVMGIWMIAYSGSVPLGALWAGELARNRGVTMVMQLSAVLCAIVALGAATTGVLSKDYYVAVDIQAGSEAQERAA